MWARHCSDRFSDVGGIGDAVNRDIICAMEKLPGTRPLDKALQGPAATLAASIYQSMKAEILQRLKMSEEASTFGLAAIGALGAFAFGPQVVNSDVRGILLLLVPFIGLVATSAMLHKT